ncbi:MAG: GNAT family N-acetyltransferase [Actinobacteria bacterium]|nr:GNAT family N-acetyltransferase [Actinomycetota bacterium]
MAVVRPARPDDSEVIAVLMDELDRFYGADEVEPVEQRAKQIQATVFRSPPPAHVLLAWEGSEPVGLATYSFLWPAAGVTQALYLKELYVAADHRRRGIGELLMQHVCQIALDHGCSRVEWTTDVDNGHAQAFYDDLDLPKNQTKIFYRLEGGELDRVAYRTEPAHDQ